MTDLKVSREKALTNSAVGLNQLSRGEKNQMHASLKHMQIMFEHSLFIIPSRLRQPVATFLRMIVYNMVIRMVRRHV